MNLKNEEVLILKSIINTTKEDLHYKTITSDFGKNLNEFVYSSALDFSYCNNELIIDKNELIITVQEISFLKEKFKEIKKINLEKIKEEFQKNRTKSNIIYLSKPILFRNNTMAIYYSRSSYGGGFSLMKKIDGEWISICSSQVWIE